MIEGVEEKDVEEALEKARKLADRAEEAASKAPPLLLSRTTVTVFEELTCPVSITLFAPRVDSDTTHGSPTAAPVTVIVVEVTAPSARERSRQWKASSHADRHSGA